MSEYGMAIYVADPSLTFSDAQARVVADKLAEAKILGEPIPAHGWGRWRPGSALGTGPFVERARIRIVSFDTSGLYEAAIWDATCAEEPLAKTCFFVEAWECAEDAEFELIERIVRETLGTEVKRIPIWL